MKLAAAIVQLCALSIMAAFIAVPSQAWAKSPINKNWRGLAIQGYDPVAYFILNKPVKGKKEFEYTYQDATWRFANAKHLKLFTSDPEKYAPQYGGY